MIVKLLTEHHLEFLSLKGGYRGSSESTLVKMSNCWKSHASAQIIFWPRPEEKQQVNMTSDLVLGPGYDKEIPQPQTNPSHLEEETEQKCNATTKVNGTCHSFPLQDFLGFAALFFFLCLSEAKS